MSNQKILKDYLRKCKADGLKEATITTAEATLTPFIDWCGEKDLQAFTRNDIYDYLDFIDNYKRTTKAGKVIKYSPGTKQRIKMVLKKFLGYVNPDLGAVIKLRKLKDGKIPDNILTRDEIEKLIEACRNNRDRAIVTTFYESGARRGELLAVQLKHVIFDENGAILNIQIGKTGSRRIRLILASSYLRQWIETHPLKNDPTAYLFCSNNFPYKVITYVGLANQLHEIAERAGIQKDRVNPHAFRHARATHLAEQLPEQLLKEYLGWTKSSTMASVYVHLSGRDIDNAILKLHGIETDDAPKKLTVNKCPRCRDINPENARFCNKCGLPFTQEAAITVGSIMNDYTVSADQEEITAMKNELKELKQTYEEELFKLKEITKNRR
jgi:Site-specific recombinase XerD